MVPLHPLSTIVPNAMCCGISAGGPIIVCVFHKSHITSQNNDVEQNAPHTVWKMTKHKPAPAALIAAAAVRMLNRWQASFMVQENTRNCLGNSTWLNEWLDGNQVKMLMVLFGFAYNEDNKLPIYCRQAESAMTWDRIFGPWRSMAHQNIWIIKFSFMGRVLLIRLKVKIHRNELKAR